VTTAVLHIGQLITMSGPKRLRIGHELSRLGEVNDGALVIEGGLLSWVGQTDDLRGRAFDDEIDVGGRLVTPGLVDAHTHAVFAGNRKNEFEWRTEGVSYREIKERGGGILSTVRATRAASEEDLLTESRRHVNWMLAHGTTTAEVKSGYGLSPEAELKMLRVASRLTDIRIMPTYLGAHAVPPEAKSRETYLEEVISMLPEAARLAKFCDIFVEEGYFTPADARTLSAAAQKNGLKMRVHVDQFSDNGGAVLAAELGAKTADHLEHTGIDGTAALRHGGVIPVLLPASVYGLGLSKYADARAMIEQGLPVVFATDFNPGSSPCPSLPMAMSLACTQMKMTPAEALTGCTINAAYSLDLGDVVGSLEVGKTADFVTYDCEDYREVPYWFGRNPVDEVYVAGKSQSLSHK
jgi:imidazolonepropionase